ncbi:hypothetical protein OHA10_15810 [Kribbella sp. NBC_00662]|uniref:hypothetical protein n=1 Tax=Kribbella sp. NBC_00662 TaxID=2975969 RepID=UPI003244FA73
MGQQVVDADEQLQVRVEEVAVDLDRGAGQAAAEGRGEGVQRGQHVGLCGGHRFTQYRIQS